MQAIEEQPLSGAVPRLEIPGWRERFGIVAGITGRGNEARPFDLGLWTAQPVGEVMSRWRDLRAAAPGFLAHVLGNQVHQTRVLWHDHAQSGWTQIEGVDGHGTASPGLMLYVTVADCVPVYLVDSKSRSIALLHAGWRGVASGILRAGIEALSHKSRSHSTDVVMHCGVSICSQCYEVGSEVISALGLVGNAEGKAQADLPTALEVQARQLGIRQVTRSSWCSAHHGDRFFSHRRSKGFDGRMVAYLGLLPGRTGLENRAGKTGEEIG